MPQVRDRIMVVERPRKVITVRFPRFGPPPLNELQAVCCKAGQGAKVLLTNAFALRGGTLPCCFDFAIRKSSLVLIEGSFERIGSSSRPPGRVLGRASGLMKVKSFDAQRGGRTRLLGGEAGGGARTASICETR